MKVWGNPTDSSIASKKLAKHKASNASWYHMTYEWSDTSKVKVEGKLSIKLLFEAEEVENGNYKPIKGNMGIRAGCDCFPLHGSAY